MSAGYNALTSGVPLSASAYNANVQAWERQSLSMFGCGVLSGLVLSDGGSLDLDVSSGVAQGLEAVAVPGFTGSAPNNVTRYVWLDWTPDAATDPQTYTGSLIFSASSTSPGANLVPLGRVTTVAGAITLITNENRQELARWTDGQTFVIGVNRVVVDDGNGWVGINKTPTVALDVSGEVLTDSTVTAGTVLTALGQFLEPSNIEGLSATKTLTAASPNVQWLIALSADRDVKLPANADITPGSSLSIINAGDPGTGAQNHNLILKTSAGSAITGGTIAPGSRVDITPILSVNDPVWPTAVYPFNASSDLPADPLRFYIPAAAVSVAICFQLIADKTRGYTTISICADALTSGTLTGNLTINGSDVTGTGFSITTANTVVVVGISPTMAAVAGNRIGVKITATGTGPGNLFGFIN